jgi:hypothetical protein
VAQDAQQPHYPASAVTRRSWPWLVVSGVVLLATAATLGTLAGHYYDGATVLNNASNIVQIVGFPLALLGLLFAWREGRNSRDLQAALALADSFRSGWEASWREALMTAEKLTK